MISNRTEYAVRALSELARSGRITKSGEIAERQKIPPKFLPHIMSDLAKSGLVKTSRGFGGGITLNRPPQEITFKSVVEAVQGPIVTFECLTGRDDCEFSKGCILKPIWQKVQVAVDEVLTSVTLKDLLEAEHPEVEDGNT
jgi:Rrf2 family protein